jgi:hypothetical protein
MSKLKAIRVLILVCLVNGSALAQISPGPLASVHSHLEGLSNCTKCHELGDKVTNAKCLACHTELKARVDLNKGYHSSGEVKGKSCVTCHNDHHGLSFQILRFNKESFNHNLTGFRLTGAHALKGCADCHKNDFITNASVKKKKITYLGLSTACLGCHTDYHQKTLSQSCTNCHTNDAFKPATGFLHASARFQLHGMHESVQCIKCHPVTNKNGAKFQQFTGLSFASCNSCHTDPHQGKFGADCKSCHSEESFMKVKGIANFNHAKTGYPLENKHRSVLCSSCHKVNLTDPVKHARCLDCHKDYHEGQFATQGQPQDCNGCHTTLGYTLFSYTIDQHNASKFKLEGSHLATPCIACHKKTDKWSFRDIGITCVDCHKDIHSPNIAPKYYPGSSCQSCHNPSAWSEVTFDHATTGWVLSGPHATKSCRTCHFIKNPEGQEVQRFSGMLQVCANCHKDNHFGQFDVNGATDCLRCHEPDYWKIEKFDHNNKTSFKLDGRHENVPCTKCHKNVTEGQNTYVFYKIKDTRCESCH